MEGLDHVRGIIVEGWVREAAGPFFYLAMPAFLVAATLLYLWSRRINRDLVGLFLVILAASFVVWYAGVHATKELIDDDAIEALAETAVSLAVFGLAGLCLHRTWAALQGDRPGPKGADHV